MKKTYVWRRLITILMLSAVLCGCGTSGEKMAAGDAKVSDTPAEVTAKPSPEAYDADEVEEAYFDVDDSSVDGINQDEYKKYTNGKSAGSTDSTGSTGNTSNGGSTDSGTNAGTSAADANKSSTGSGQSGTQVLDEYYTSAVPEGMPLPVEPEDADVDTGDQLTCTLLIECATIFDHMDKLNPAKNEVLPSDGVIYARRSVVLYEGESVFDVLLRETQNNRIHMEYEMTPIYNSNYIEGINNLYEFDCGDLSGWMYNVNGWYPNYGCSRYQLKDGDAVEWCYTCDLGRDLGVNWVQQ